MNILKSKTTRSSKSIRKKLVEPQLSCGRIITTTRLGRDHAWWACGLALTTFENELKEEFDIALRNKGLRDADIYFQLYMIGRRPETANPIVFICCLDESVRNKAEASIRNSDILTKYPEFGLGVSALPLEQQHPGRQLAADDSEMTDVGAPHEEPVVVDSRIQQPTPLPKIGSRVYAVNKTTNTPRYATGGVIVKIKGRDFQMVVDHIDEPDVAEPDSTLGSDVDYDECRFDGQSDDEEDDEIGSEYDSMRSGSRSPPIRELSWVENPRTTDSGQSSTVASPDVPPESSTPRVLHGYLSQALQQPNEADKRPSTLFPTQQSSQIEKLCYRSKYGKHPSLDYAFRHVNLTSSTNSPNTIDLGPSGLLEVQPPVTIESEERQIIVVTGSGGVTRGSLSPAPTYFRKALTRSPHFQKLHVLQIDSLIMEGDCGSVVVDASTGHLLGHIVRGCPGTHTAYMIPATEVFADIKSKYGQDVFLARRVNSSWGRGVRDGLRSPILIPLRYGEDSNGMSR